MADWTSRAACRDLEPEIFFPPGETKTSFARIDEAKAICGRCVVQARCLEFALETDAQFGVWGGLSTTERRHGAQFATSGGHRAADHV